MTFFAFGLNHETASVALREAFALNEEKLREVYRSVRLSDEAELLLLSTCNRTEVYLYGRRQDVAGVQAALAERAGTAWPSDSAFAYEDEAAIRHLFRVSVGLRSMVLGDGQILMQVKDAYRLAVGEDRIGTLLHRLLHTAFHTAKRVITETLLTNGSASVPAAAVALARRHLGAGAAGGLSDRRALVVGAGRMARLVLEALAPHEPAQLTVVNRSGERAADLAQQFGARVTAWEDRHAAVRDAEVVFVASGACEPVLHAGHLPARSSTDTPVLVVDIAVPRNVEPAVDHLPGYTVVDLDALQASLTGVAAQRRAEVPAAEAICEEALFDYVSWVFHQQALQPTILAIRETFESIRAQEVERHHHRFSDIDRVELDRLTTSIIQKLLAVPVVRLKSVDPESIDFARGLKLLHALFSRPACEDESATPRHVDLARHPLFSEVPAECPFELGCRAEAVDPEKRLRDALRAPRADGG